MKSMRSRLFNIPSHNYLCEESTHPEIDGALLLYVYPINLIQDLHTVVGLARVLTHARDFGAKYLS